MKTLKVYEMRDSDLSQLGEVHLHMRREIATFTDNKGEDGVISTDGHNLIVGFKKKSLAIRLSDLMIFILKQKPEYDKTRCAFCGKKWKLDSGIPTES